MTDAALTLLPVSALGGEPKIGPEFQVHAPIGNRTAAYSPRGRLSRSYLVSKLRSRNALNAPVLLFPVVHSTTQSKKEARLCHEKRV